MANPLHSSLSNEHYTPYQLIQSSTELMGGIEVDFCSSWLANKIVQADRYYHKEDSVLNRGLIPGRSGFCNPFGGKLVNQDGLWVPSKSGRSAQAVIWDLVYRSWLEGVLEQAVFLAFNLNSAIALCPEMAQFPMCFTSSAATSPVVSSGGRIKFWLSMADGKAIGKPDVGELGLWDSPDSWRFVEESSPQHPNLIVYLPPKGVPGIPDRFRELFEQFGSVVIPGLGTYNNKMFTAKEANAVTRN